MQNNARERGEYPATRNRTRDHLIAAEVYSQILYQLSHSRRWRSTVFQAIAPQACYQGFTLDVIYVCLCVCVCVRATASKRKGIPDSTTRVCVVPGLRFTGGGTGNKKNARGLFGPFLPKGGDLRKGKDLKNKHPQNLSGPLLRGGGWRKQKPAQHLSGHRWRREREP